MKKARGVALSILFLILRELQCVEGQFGTGLDTKPVV